MNRVARAFIQNKEGKFLFVKHTENGSWALPGGHIEDGESIYKALKREIREELNLEIEIIGNKLGIEFDFLKEKPLPICIYKIHYKNKSGKMTKKLEYIFMTKIKEGKIKVQQEEIFEYKFFDYNEVINDETIYLQTKEILKRIYRTEN